MTNEEFKAKKAEIQPDYDSLFELLVMGKDSAAYIGVISGLIESVLLLAEVMQEREVVP